MNINDIRAKQTIFLLKYLGNSETQPSSVDLTTSEIIAAGATTGGFSAAALTLPKNALLEAPTDLLVNRSSVDLTGGADLTLSTYGGASADGITTELASGATVSWDALYPDVGMDSHPFSKNSNVNNLTGAEYHGQGDDIQTDEFEVSSIAPAISRNGLIDWGSQLHKDLEKYADTNSNWWGKQIIISKGVILATRQNIGRVRGWSEGVTVGGKLSCQYTFQFFDDATLTFAS
jgi:hypothetical protein